MKAKVAPKNIIQTLFGPEEQMYKCNTCSKEYSVEHFYVASENPSRPRTQCKHCWTKFNGRSKFSNVAMFEVK
jgi:DNA-directed RNA polymerase subunit RPC12/RpoP